MKSLKSTMDQLTAEQNGIKSRIDNLMSLSTETEKRIDSIESEVTQLKKESTTNACPSIISPENLITEIQERQVRACNIIINGIPESDLPDPEERQAHDREEALKIIRKVSPACRDPLQTHRLGKHKANKTRMLKVCLHSKEDAKAILSNHKNKTDSKISIYSDKTPQQQNYFNNLKKELEDRIAGGELNLTIKYHKGTPKIIQLPAKN